MFHPETRSMVASRILALILVLGVAATAPGQEPPPLEPPDESTRSNTPSASSQPAQDPSKPSANTNSAPQTPVPNRPAQAQAVTGQNPNPGQLSGNRVPNRPLLVIPGVNAPASTNTTRPRAPSSPMDPMIDLMGPIEESPSIPSATTQPGVSRRNTIVSEPRPRASIPMTVEPLDEAEDTPRRSRPAAPAATNTRVPPTGRRSPAGPPYRGPSAPDPRAATRPPARQGFLSRLFGLGTPRPEPPAHATNPSAARSPAERPGNDATARRLLEREITAALGEKARSVEVRVTGRNALVVVKPTRFWQKRTIRATIESLPALAGYRTRIDVLD